MRSIKVADGTHEQLRLLARAWDTSEADVVRRLLDAFAGPGDAPPEAGTGDWVDVRAIHDGHPIEGRFHRLTHRLEITSGRLAGAAFKSPSGAAVAVVKTYTPHVSPNRNGWLFWVVAETGKPLDSIRGSLQSAGA